MTGLGEAKFDLVPCGFVALGTDGYFLEANDAFCEMVGVSPAELASLKFPHFLPAAGRLLYATQISARLLLEGSVREVALDLVRRSGTRTPVLINARLERKTAEQPDRILMAIFGTIERRGYEQELLRSQRATEQMAEVIHRSSDAIVTASEDGLVQSWNQGAESMFGVRCVDAMSNSLPHLIFEEPQRVELLGVMEKLRGGHRVLLETTAKHRLGHELAVSINLTPHIEPPGDLVSFSAIIRDITPRKLSEKALIQNEKLASLGRLASSIAHEINNPLESVTNLLYILEFQTTDPEMKSNIRLAQEELARVSQITTHTLRFHKQNSNASELDLGVLFSSILAMYRVRLLELGTEIRVSRSTSSPLLCYEGEVRQIVTNLIANAIDAMPRGGRLTLRHRDATLWASEGRGVRITVADNGTGISEDHLQHILEPFFTTKGMGGTGLGLWITHELIQKNQGTIRVRSRRGLGRSGTVFVVCFRHAS